METIAIVGDIVSLITYVPRQHGFVYYCTMCELFQFGRMHYHFLFVLTLFTAGMKTL